MVDEKFLKYANDVIDGKITAGHLMKLACKRYISFFDRDDIYFDEEKAEKPVRFISKLKHTRGEFAGHSFILQDWQAFIIYAVFGFYNKSDNSRLCKSAYIQIARKCGKTSLASALGLYGLMADGEAGAEVTCVAPSAVQSNIAFTSAKEYVESINRKNILRCLRSEIKFDYNHSRFRIMSSDAKFGDGFNPSLAIIDEYHAFPNNDIPNLLLSGTGMRKSPLMIYITTAGFNLYSPCKAYRDTCEEILEGLKTDDTIFPFIYELDPEDDWQDRRNWKKCCPSLGITVGQSFMEQQLVLANNMAFETVPIMTKTFNVWCSSSSIWLKDQLLIDSSSEFDLSDLAKQGLTAYCGLDLASVSDLTAFSVMVPSFKHVEGTYADTIDKLYFKSWAFIPEVQLKESPNKELYKKWVREGHVIVTPGNVTDYDYVLSKMVEVSKQIPIIKVAYDTYNATQFTIMATQQGFNMSPYSQALANFNKPTKEFERQIKLGNVVLDNNEVVRWCFANTALKFDNKDNAKPIKGGSDNQKIDCVVSIIESLGGMMEDPQNKIYFESI